ncbi:hypothetical protein NEAUS05_1027 [Nematocida ausubeli]|nr:hypothetical protein NEAUS05_1027 [Nematocida ausubeli]
MNMEMKTHECLYKRNNRQISIKLLAKVLLMVSLLAMQNVFGLLSRECADNVLEELVEKFEKYGIELNMDGPLNPIMLFLCDKMDTLCNRRFNSPYSPEQCSDAKEMCCMQTMDKKPDSIYRLVKEEDRLSICSKEHYNALVNMFPSPDRKISIYPKEGCKDSFTSFLKSEHVKEYAHKILAVLLLQTEGMDVQLRIENEESECPMLVWSNKNNDKDTFSVPIDIAGSTEEQNSRSSNEELSIKKKGSQTLQTIKYFINEELHKKVDVDKIRWLQSDLDESLLWDEFSVTPAWLIQSYICYYLETKEDLIKLYCEIIQKVIASKLDTTPIGYLDVVWRFFRKIPTPEKKELKTFECWEMFKELKDLIEAEERFQVLPFADNSQLPAKTTVEENTPPEEGLIPSDIESVVLTLLCIFVYDPMENAYNVDHLPNIPEEVKNLFCISSIHTCASSNPSEINRDPSTSNLPSNSMPIIQVGKEIPQEALSKWSEIIQNLVKEDKNISYTTIEDRRMIDPNIFNILIIMIKVTGMDYKKYMEEMREYIQEYQEERFDNKIRDYVARTFSQMSRESLGNQTIHDWCLESSTSSEDKNPRRICVEFRDGFIKSSDAKEIMTKFMYIYYATQNKAQRIDIYLTSTKEIYLRINKYIRKFNNPRIFELKTKLSKVAKTSYTIYALSKCAESMDISNTDYNDEMIDLAKIYERMRSGYFNQDFHY